MLDTHASMAMADDAVGESDTKTPQSQNMQQELPNQRSVAECGSSPSEDSDATMQPPPEIKSSKLLDEDIPMLCTLETAQVGFITIAIIHDGVSEETTITKEDICFMQLRETSTIQGAIQVYQARFPDKHPISVAIATTNESAHDEEELADVHKASTGSMLVLRASALPPSIRAEKVEDNQEIEDLWMLHANFHAVTLFEDATLTKKDEAIIKRWQTLSEKEAKSLVEHKEQIGSIAKDAVDLRAFYILYHRLKADVDLSSALQPSMNTDAFARSVLRAWRKQKPAKLKALREEAVSQIRKLSLPTLPAQGPSLDLFKDHLESMLVVPEEELDELTDDVPLALESQPLEALEISADNYTKLLETMYARIKTISSTTKQVAWLADIERLQQQKIESHAKIGIVGSTGSGKSSIINALLGESKLVPTSCWRACTAVVTEISYNHNGPNGSPYRGEVRFITKTDWKTELEALASDMFDGSGKLNQDSDNRSSEAGIALDKIVAVCPGTHRSQITRATIRSFLEHDNVKNLLGTTKVFAADTAEELSKALDKYVDSKDRMKTDYVGGPQEPALWPIVQSVRLFTKSPMLKDGIELVDLPGVHDSNRARAEVAKNYLKTCSHLFIVAPLTRAVDDKSAKELLGESFKRQMKLDGTYTSATFIGSKADDIGPVSDIARSLGVSIRIRTIEEEQARSDAYLLELNQELQQAIRLSNSEGQKANDVADLLYTYRRLRKQAVKFGSVPEPHQTGHKRRRTTMHSASTARSRRIPDREVSEDDDSEEEDPPERLLSVADVDAKCLELKNRREISWARIDELEANCRALEARIKAVNVMNQELDEEKWRVCVAARNEKTRQTIRLDFAMGLKEYDQQLATNLPDFDPDVDLRDYAQVAEQLSVFCVSARGYQRLMGLSSDKKSADQFSSLEQTEIPALQNHAIDLSQSSRKTHLARFINRAGILTTTMKMWAAETGLGSGMSEAEVLQNRDCLKDGLEVLRKELDTSMTACVESNNKDIQSGIISMLAKAQSQARLKAMNTSKEWGSPGSANYLVFQSYKATVKRDGVYQSPRLGPIDFNDQLTKPMLDMIVLGWDKVFHIKIPQTIETAADGSGAALESFRTLFKRIARNLSINRNFSAMLYSQLSRYTNSLQDAFISLRYDILIKQKELSRSLAPSIQTSMKPVYQAAFGETGKGAFKRMKQTVEDGVAQNSSAMFSGVRRQVRKGLESMLSTTEKDLRESVSGTLRQMENDYISIFQDKDEQVTEEQLELKSDITEIMKEFQRAATDDMEEVTVIKEESAVPEKIRPQSVGEVERPDTEAAPRSRSV